MKHWKKYYIVLIPCVLLLLNACTITEPTRGTNSNVIDEALKDSLRANSAAINSSHKNKPGLPLALQKALLPEPSLPNVPVTTTEPLEPRFDIAVNNIPAKDFFMGLVKDTRYNITINPQISGTISLELKAVTVPQVMDAVRDNYGFEYEKTSYGYKVFPRHLETRVFNVNYLDIELIGQSQIMIGSGQITSANLSQNNANTNASTTASSGSSNSNSAQSTTPSGLVNTSSTSKFWELLKQNLETIIGTQDGRSVVVNPRSGTVIARAFPNELRYIAQYLDSIQNIIHRQVIIEAKILEIQLTAGFANGINWRALGLYQGQQVASESSSDNSQAPTTFPGNIVGVVGMNATDGGAFGSVIQFLNTQGRVNVLSSPHIATINNQKAVIKVGSDDFFVTNVSSNTNNNSTGNSTETANITLTPFFSGISLDVTPQIDENDNVTMHIHPIVSDVTQKTKSFVVNEKKQSLPLAQSTVRESDSIVRAKNGQVIIIGGLMASAGKTDQSSTPSADRLPGIGGLFKNNQKSDKKIEIVILLRPIIAENSATWQQQLQNAAINIKKMKDDFGYNIVPKKIIK